MPRKTDAFRVFVLGLPRFNEAAARCRGKRQLCVAAGAIRSGLQ